MDIEVLINKMKVIYPILMDYIDSTDDFDDQFNQLNEVLEKQDILQNNEEVQLFLQLISRIADSHHHTPYFFTKL